MDPRLVFFLVLGIGLAIAVTIDRACSRIPLSLPMVFVALGYGVFSLPLDLPFLDPAADGAQAHAIEYLTEFIVIVSLMGAGIAIDRPVSWRNWRQVVPLLVVVMPLSIAAVAFVGWAWLGLAPAAAILLGAALSPTDPVLAESVQVGPPGSEERNDVRFSLTAEAGFNDGLAFPFTHLAIAAAGATGVGSWIGAWALEDLLWRTFAGCLVGFLVGRLGSWFVFRYLPEDEPSLDGPITTSEGVIVLGALLGSYSLAEFVHGYGFLAVFVAAVTARQCESKSGYHAISHHFLAQVERIVLVAMLLGFGGLLASGVLAPLTWRGAALAALLILVVRPAAGMLAQVGSRLPRGGRFAVAFLGVRGMGTLYYLAYAQNHGEFEGLPELWAVASFAILLSIVVHGVAASPLLGRVSDAGDHVFTGLTADVE